MHLQAHHMQQKWCEIIINWHTKKTGQEMLVTIKCEQNMYCTFVLFIFCFSSYVFINTSFQPWLLQIEGFSCTIKKYISSGVLQNWPPSPAQPSILMQQCAFCLSVHLKFWQGVCSFQSLLGPWAGKQDWLCNLKGPGQMEIHNLKIIKNVKWQ